jgi:hypothetical protein
MLPAMRDSNSRRPMVRIPLISTVDRSHCPETRALEIPPINLSPTDQHYHLTLDTSIFEGSLTAESSDASVAQVRPARKTDPEATLVITPTGLGSCQLLISDRRGPIGSVNVIVCVA